MPVNDANTNFTDPYGISNIEFKYTGTRGPLQLEIKAGVQNIFDINYAAMLAVNAPGIWHCPTEVLLSRKSTKLFCFGAAWVARLLNRAF
jgi:hypothetical protein